jgi:hypothetical protein
MEFTQGSGIENVTLSEILALDTWNEARSSEQLQSFIARRHEAIEGQDEE